MSKVRVVVAALVLAAAGAVGGFSVAAADTSIGATAGPHLCC